MAAVAYVDIKWLEKMAIFPYVFEGLVNWANFYNTVLVNESYIFGVDNFEVVVNSATHVLREDILSFRRFFIITDFNFVKNI